MSTNQSALVIPNEQDMIALGGVFEQAFNDTQWLQSNATTASTDEVAIVAQRASNALEQAESLRRVTGSAIIGLRESLNQAIAQRDEALEQVIDEDTLDEIKSEAFDDGVEYAASTWEPLSIDDLVEQLNDELTSSISWLDRGLPNHPDVANFSARVEALFVEIEALIGLQESLSRAAQAAWVEEHNARIAARQSKNASNE